jgi:hypothetical protein
MHDKLFIPTVIVLALACYYVLLISSGRIFNPFTATGRWVYRSEEPKLFWASTLQYALGFATILLLLYFDHSVAAKVTIVVAALILGGVIQFRGTKL